jgi:hypothetical protein
MATFLLHNKHISSYNEHFGFSNIKVRQLRSKIPALNSKHYPPFVLVIVVANNVFDSSLCGLVFII